MRLHKRTKNIGGYITVLICKTATAHLHVAGIKYWAWSRHSKCDIEESHLSAHCNLVLGHAGEQILELERGQDDDTSDDTPDDTGLYS